MYREEIILMGNRVSVSSLIFTIKFIDALLGINNLSYGDCYEVFIRVVCDLFEAVYAL